MTVSSQWLEIERPDATDYQPDESVASAVASILWLASQHDQPKQFLAELLPALSQAFEAVYVTILQAKSGRWQTVAQFGRHDGLPYDFLGDTLDQSAVGQTVIDDNHWLAAPLDPRGRSGEVLLLCLSDAAGHGISQQAQYLANLAPVIGRASASVRESHRKQRRLNRLEAILEIAGSWNQTREMEPLLVQMAEAATKLLGADRASIFLWDKSSRTVVGRPALGVEDGELRIPDDAGVVGYVLQTGESRRVGQEGQDQINRQVDKKLGYQTRTLLAVPLNGSDGERFGVFEVINKLEGAFTEEDEVALNELAAHAAIALENTQEREDLLATRRQIAEQAAQSVRLIGESAPIQALRSTIERVAKIPELAVLILGENGTGKEVVSRSIHYLSDRRDKPFIAVNCAALAETLLESELFGHEKGAFTDAHDTRQGKFELASGGTLFLDEIGDMSPGGQAKLLRVLEEKVVTRVGGSQSIHTDARVIAATNQNLVELVRKKKFREDLYYRLRVVEMELPPLRERGDDVLLLAEHFLADFCSKAGRRKVPKFSAEARRRLVAHGWPGNVRELRNLMERLAYLSQGDRIEKEDLAFMVPPGEDEEALGMSLDLPLSQATDKFQAEYIKKAIDRVRGNMSEAAKLLGLHRSNLYRKMRQLKMDDGK